MRVQANCFLRSIQYRSCHRRIYSVFRSVRMNQQQQQQQQQQQLEQWHTALESESCQRFLVQARQAWREMLRKAQDANMIYIDSVTFLLLAVDISVLDQLRRVFMKNEATITKLALVLGRRLDVLIHEDTRAFNPPVPRLVGMTVVNGIARLVRNARALVSIVSNDAPLVYTISLLAACQQPLETFWTILHDDQDEDQLLELAELVETHETSLGDVSLTNLKPHSFRALCPLIPTLSEVWQLRLGGNWLSPDNGLLVISSTDEAVVLCNVLQMDSLQYVEFENVHFATTEAGHVFCSALEVFPLNNMKLKLGMHFHFPEHMRLRLVSALARSSLRGVDLQSPVGQANLIAFGDAFAASRNYTIANLNLFSPSQSLWYGLERPEHVASGFDDQFVQQVKRRLDLNLERQSSVATFAKFYLTTQHVPDPLRRVQFGEVFSVQPAIVFEYLRHDDYGLLTAIIQASTGDSVIMDRSSGAVRVIEDKNEGTSTADRSAKAKGGWARAELPVWISHVAIVAASILVLHCWKLDAVYLGLAAVAALCLVWVISMRSIAV